MPSTRRRFIQLNAAAAAAVVARPLSANSQIQFATIGIGGMGTEDTNSALAAPGTKLVAASDIYEGRLTRVKEVFGKDIFTTRDYREVLARKDIDAVVIATPDHLHRRITVDAVKAGKDVYVEKPMVQKVEEGLAMVRAQKETGKIIQVGSQRVSSIVYLKAKELIATGAIGEVNMVEAWWDRNSAIGAWQYSIPPDAREETIDWDRFLSHAPKRPFEPIRLFRWRNYQDYGTGVAGDLFVHLFSGMHVVMNSIGPTRVYATGGLRFWDDGRDVPDVMFALCDYPKRPQHPGFNLVLRVNFADGSGGSHKIRFVGSEGVLTIGNGVTLEKRPRAKEPGYTINTFPEATQEKFLAEYHKKYPLVPPTAASIRPQVEEVYQTPRGYNDHRHHHRNFFSAVRNRTAVVEDAVFGCRAAGPALLANRSYFERRACGWDPENMKAADS
jgi:predicted dehydrogenase